MVAYAPPDRVILNVGASFHTEPLMAAIERLLPTVTKDVAHLATVGMPPDVVDLLKGLQGELRALHRDARAKKNDTPLPMSGVSDTMAHARAWLLTLRRIALVNLGLDTPALNRVASLAPELVEGYARDVLADLESRVEAARDLKPRLEECGLSDAFLGRGRTLARQLRTAIGGQDIDPANLHFTLRRLYMRKGDAYLLLKRTTRAGQLAFAQRPERARLYHLDEIEPSLEEPLAGPKPAKPTKS